MTAAVSELSVLEAVHECVARGLSVFPLYGFTSRGCACNNAACNDSGKHPCESGWTEGVIYSTPEAVDQRFKNQQALNYAIATGLEVGSTGKALVVIDLDSYKEGADDHFHALQAMYGKLPDTAEVHTGGGGRHFYFMAPLGLKFRQKMGHEGIDIKGVGGYVVGPGSMHRSGKPYVTEASSDLFEGQEIADLPDWLIEQFGKVAKEQPSVHSSDLTISLPASPLTPHEEASVWSDLNMLSASCSRDEWLSVLMALHSRSQTMQMLSIADKWSQTAPEKYNSAAVIAAWNSFTADGGITYAYVRAAARKEIAKSVNLTKLLESLNRMPVTGGDENMADAAADDVPVTDKYHARRYKLLSARQLADSPPLKWTIRGTLPQTGLAALYGQSGTGKSFLALAMSMAIAGADNEWFGMAVTNCLVTYCALEGEGGMGKRAQAWEKFHKIPLPDRINFMIQPFDLMKPADVADLGHAIVEAGGAGGVVILDTLNRAAPGADENTSQDMGKILNAAKLLQEFTGGLVLLVHHSGKDLNAGLRGHSSLKAAMDCVISVHRTGIGLSWAVEKSKDDVTGRSYPFRLETVTVGEDDDGEAITSCVAVATVPPDALRQTKKLGKHQQVAINVLRRLFEASNSPDSIVDYQTAVMSIAAEVDATANHKTLRAKDAITALGNQRLIYLGDAYVAPAGHVPDEEGDDDDIVCRVGN